MKKTFTVTVEHEDAQVKSSYITQYIEGMGEYLSEQLDSELDSDGNYNNDKWISKYSWIIEAKELE